MTKRAIIAVGILIALAVIGFVASSLFKGSSNVAPGASNAAAAPSGKEGTTPIAQAIPSAPTGAFLNIGTGAGTVAVKNFYPGSSVAEGGTVVMEATDAFTITYDPSTSGFWIMLSEPFAPSRKAAEAEFVKVLDISQTDACKLSVEEGVPYSPNDALAGRSFPLSFCLGNQ